MWNFLFGGRNREADTSTSPELLAIHKTVDVPAERAFEVFVDRLGSWWPRELTWAKDDLDEIGIEAKMDGHCFERRKDATTAIWGTVLTILRPEHIVFTWQIAPNHSPEPNPVLASRVDVRFAALTPETTDIVLVHRDFPRHGSGWQKYRAALAAKSGWPLLLDRYAQALSRLP